jgi:hypothetical protein
VTGGSGGYAGRVRLADGGVEVQSVLHAGRQAYLAVETSSGPHVTPQFYGMSGDDLVTFSSASARKVKAAESCERASVLVRSGSRSLVVFGRVEVVDPIAVSNLLHPRRALRSARATASFALRNAPDLAGFARDAVRGRTGRPKPSRRVMLRLDADGLALVEEDRLIRVAGDWPGTGAATEPPVESDTDGTWVAAVLAVASAVGTLAVPAAWDGGANRARVLTSLLDLGGVTWPGRASVVLDEYTAPGPAAKQGVLLAGDATAEPGDGGWTLVSLEPDRTSVWSGTESTTTRPGATKPRGEPRPGRPSPT